MYYIGVDLGTSAVKLLLMEESGKICNIVSKEYPKRCAGLSPGTDRADILPPARRRTSGAEINQTGGRGIPGPAPG